MDNLYLIMVIALGVLAIADLIIGVSNDAVNFLNSAIGSKVLSFRTIMIVASIGIILGAVFSSGMMEVARKGIFNPGEFYFDEIMFIFMAVMITDILLLDFFNTIGMPTSTTVSIVFELLGAAVAMAFIKVLAAEGSFEDVLVYINTSKATEIILGILLSVVIAFSIGAAIQWVSRLLLSFDFEKKSNWVGAIFGGIALTAITYFILFKGIGGTSFAERSYDIIGGLTIETFLEVQLWPLLVSNMVFWAIISYLIVQVGRISIYKVIIGAGTFALALAFAGNDLVNFIGVPIAGYQSYLAWTSSGLAATELEMDILTTSVPTPTFFLFISGVVMVLTIWLSKKARYVTDTEINLAREGEAKERFNPNFLSRYLVRFSMYTANNISAIVPTGLREKINHQFKKPEIKLSRSKTLELPAFDMVRAAVNMMVAGILISIATSYKLPLSTTYVTFMVAMGTSLADRAWGSESAVYRVAGVLNVIGGWFMTAIIAFIAASVVLTLISFGKGAAIIVLLFVAILLLARNYISYTRKSREIRAEDSLKRTESSSINGVMEESYKNISNVIKRSHKIYSNSINGLATQNLIVLNKNKKQVAKLSTEIDELRDSIFYFIKNLDEKSVGASHFYINMLSYLQDMAQTLEYIGKVCHKHVHNNHKKLKFNQVKDLKEIEMKLGELLTQSKDAFDNHSLGKIETILESKPELFELVSQKIEKQISHTRTEESSPKNTTLYFSLLLESKDLMVSTFQLLEQYTTTFNGNGKPPPGM